MNKQMRTLSFGILLLALIAFVPANSWAASGSGTAGADIIFPLDIVFEEPLDFGDIILTSAGTVTVSPDSFVPEVVTGGLALTFPSTAGRGLFGLVGDPGHSYEMTGPPGVTIKLNGTGFAMAAILNFMADSTGDTTVLGSGASATGTLHPTTGVDTVGVGGKLTVPSGAPPGPYTGNYPVTANYN